MKYLVRITTSTLAYVKCGTEKQINTCLPLKTLTMFGAVASSEIFPDRPFWEYFDHTSFVAILSMGIFGHVATGYLWPCCHQQSTAATSEIYKLHYGHQQLLKWTNSYAGKWIISDIF